MELSEGRIILRAVRAEDTETIAVLANNQKIANNLKDSFPYPYTHEDAVWFINFALNESEDHRFAIEYKGEFCGIIGLHVKDDVYSENLEIGYWIGEPYWGKGIATAAIKLICEYGFKKLRCNRIYANVFEYNKASMKVLEKNGFINEGLLRKSIIKNEQFWDEYLFGRIATDLM